MSNNSRLTIIYIYIIEHLITHSTDIQHYNLHVYMYTNSLQQIRIAQNANKSFAYFFEPQVWTTRPSLNLAYTYI